MSAVASAVPAASDPDGQIAARLRAAHAQQRQAYLADPVPTYAQRRQDLKQLKRLVLDNTDAIVEAINQDYGNRSRHETLLTELISVNGEINHNLKHLKKWMKVQRRRVDHTMFPGGRNRVIPQPLGVVGLIVPWNFPLNLAFAQIAAAFTAGNRAMVKMSENSVALSRLLIELVERYFPPEKLQFFEETGGVGIQFSQIPFDLIIFTGSGQTGKAVMAAAARNLTPVLLELGGKSPAIIDPDYPLALARAAWCHAQRSVYNWVEDIETTKAKALDHAEQAANLSADDPLILTVLVTVHAFARHYDAAWVMLERAVALDPNAAWAWSRLGWLAN